jgi:hypothetical protein
MSGSISQGISRFTTAHKLSVLRAQEAKVNLALQKLHTKAAELDLGEPALRSKDAWLRLIQLQSDSLESVTTFYRHEEQEKLLKDTKAFKALANIEPGLEASPCADWSCRLETELGHAATQSRLAVLFCDVLQQWLDTDGSDAQHMKGDALPLASTGATSDQAAPPSSPELNFDTFLVASGAPADVLERLEKMKKDTRHFGLDTLKADVESAEVLSAMTRLVCDPRWRTVDVRQQVKEESAKKMAREELASAFTTTLRSLNEWDWPEGGINVSVQTHLNGKERQHLDLDVTLAVFLEVISMRWTDHFKKCLTKLRSSRSWPESTILDTALKKVSREDVLQFNLVSMANDSTVSETVEGEISRSGLTAEIKSRQNREMLQVVSGGMNNAYGNGYGDAVSGTVSDDDEVDPGWKAPAIAAKTAKAYAEVFKLLCTDIRLLQAINPAEDVTAVHLDIKDFGPSISHAVPLAVFEFFGAPAPWLKWLKTYLEIPVKHTDGTVHRSQRGTPFGLAFSSLMNELLLVLLDMGVAFKTGLHIHRNHDDFWFWSQDQEKMVQAYATMEDFARLAGLQWNREKSGACVFGQGDKQKAIPATLPQSPFRWGYLLLQQDCSWKIDQSMIDSRVKEAQRELASTRSFLGKINVWNKYQAFFARNTAIPLRANGSQHIEYIQKTMGKIQLAITEGESFLQFLKKELRKAFPSMDSELYENLPDAMYFWPLTLGGFELHSQLVNMMTHYHFLEGLKTERKPDLIPFAGSLQVGEDLHKERAQDWQSMRVFTHLSCLAERAGSSESGRWAKNLIATNDPETWAQSGGTSFLSLEKFIIIQAAVSFGWLAEYEALSMDDSDSVNESAYRDLTKSIHQASLLRTLGQSDQIVPASLVPKYALVDVQRAVKQLFQ